MPRRRADLGLRTAAPARRTAPRRAGRDPRRGHGLRVVASIAAEHGGRFAVQRPAGGWAAILELPLAACRSASPRRRWPGPTRTEERLARRMSRRARAIGFGAAALACAGAGGRRRGRLPRRSRGPARPAAPRGRRARRALPRPALRARPTHEAARGPPDSGAVRAAGSARGARAGGRPRARGARSRRAPTCSPAQLAAPAPRHRHRGRPRLGGGREPVEISVTGAEALAAGGGDPAGAAWT